MHVKLAQSRSLTTAKQGKYGKRFVLSSRSEESRSSQVVRHDDRPCGVQHKLHIVCVGSTRYVDE